MPYRLLKYGLIFWLLGKSAWAELPTLENWIVYSSAEDSHSGGRVTELFHSGLSSGYLKSNGRQSVSSHGLLAQKISAQNYLARRVRVTGFLKTKEVTGWCGIWVRVDGFDGQVLRFDNMMDSPVRGNTDWRAYSIEFDVPSESAEIHFGVLLAGSGSVWADDFQVEVLGGTRPGQALKQRIRTLPEEAQNLGFED